MKHGLIPRPSGRALGVHPVPCGSRRGVSRAVVTVLASAAMLAFGTPGALAAPPAVVGVDGKCADDAELGKRTNWAIAHIAGAKLFADQNTNEQVTAEVAWKSRLEVFGSDKAARVFVKLRSGGLCGYMRREDIVLKRDPMTVVDLFPEQRVVKDAVEITNTWRIKAMLRSLPKDNTATNLTSVEVYQSPDASRPHATAQIFSLFNIFDVRKGTTQSPDDWWYYIGPENVLDDAAFSGWVKGRNAFLWQSAVSIYYGPANAPFDVYPDWATARAQRKDAAIGRRSTAAPPPDRDIPKFPVLDQIFDPKTEKQDRKDGKPPLAYEIGFMGRACSAAGRCLTAEDVGKELGVMGDLIVHSQNIDIVFVIDNTASMRKYFGPVSSAVSKWASEVERHRREAREEGVVRFGAATYGDYKNANSPSLNDMDFKLVSQLTTNGAARMQQKLAEEKTYGDVFADAPEAGFAALVRAATEAEWSDKAVYRFIVWIGDQGTRRYGDREPVSVEHVREVLARHKVFFAAINVAGSAFGGAANKFKSDAEDILDLGRPFDQRKVVGVEPQRTFPEGRAQDETPENAASEVTRLLYSVFAESRGLRRDLQGEREIGARLAPPKPVIRRSRSGDSFNFPAIELHEMNDVRRKVLEQFKTSEREIKELFKLQQLMERGVVVYNPDSSNLSFYAAVQPTQMANFLLPMFRSTCEQMTQSSDLGNRLKGLMTNISLSMAGQQFDPTRETIAAYLERTLFIPKRHFATWLGVPIEDLEELWQDPKKQSAIRLDVCRTAYLLSKMETGERILNLDDIVWENEWRGQLKVRDGAEAQKFTWLWRSDAGISYYFVPVEFLPHSDLSGDR